MSNTLDSLNSEILKNPNPQEFSKMKLMKQSSNVTSEDSFQTTSQHIKIFLKIKPTTSNENKFQDNTFTILSPTILAVKLPNSNPKSARYQKQCKIRESSISAKHIRFTKIFKSDVSQSEIFEQSVESKVMNFLSGQNSSIMTVGTTNSGKSYTFLGTNSNPGIVPRCIDLIFSLIKCTPKPRFRPLHANKIRCLNDIELDTEINIREKFIGKTNYLSTENIIVDKTEDDEYIYSIWLSCVEIYNESVYDLLSTNEKVVRLKIVPDRDGSTFPNKLTVVSVSTASEAHEILALAVSKLRIAASSLNPNSSRSHVIFTVKLLKYSKNNSDSDGNEVKISTLNFCDLAGPGRLETTSNTEQLLTEARYINKSLLALGRCFKVVAENHGLKQSVGPFRESCLTRLLQKTLCDREDLVLLVTLNTSPELYAETQSIFNLICSVKKVVFDHLRSARSLDLTTPVLRATSGWYIMSPYHQITKDMHINELRGRNEALTKELTDLKNTMFNRECEIRQEFADMYSNMLRDHDNEWTKRMEEIDKEKDEYMKWSVRQVENFYETRIDNLINRKRRRIDLGDYEDNKGSPFESLEAENAHITSTVTSLSASIKKLRRDREKAITEKNEYAFKLALTYQELKNFKEMGSRSSFSNDVVCSEDLTTCGQKNEGEKSEIELSETKNEICDVTNRTTLLQDQLVNKIDELTSKLMENENKLAETQSSFEQSEKIRTALSEKLMMLEKVLQIKGINTSHNDSVIPTKICDILRDSRLDISCSSISPNVNDEHSNRDESLLSLFNSSSAKVDEPLKVIATVPSERVINISDGSNRWSLLESSMEKSNQSIRLSSSSSKDDSGITMTSTSESEGDKMNSIDIQLRLSQLKEDYTMLKGQHQQSTKRVSDLSEELEIIKHLMVSLKESFALNEQKLLEYEKQLCAKEEEIKRLNEDKNELQERYYHVTEDLKLKFQEYLTMLKELNERLKIREENETRTSRFIENYLDKSVSLESKLSDVYSELEQKSVICFTEHIPTIEKLERELCTKNMHIDELDDKMSEVRKDLGKISLLNKRVDEFENILESVKKEKEDLRKRLDDKTESQFCLEGKMKRLTSVIQEREDEIKALQEELESVIEMNAANNSIAKDLGEEISKSMQKMVAVKGELLKSEETRCNLERIIKHEIGKSVEYMNFIQEENKCKQLEVNRLKTQLQEKEQELHLIKRNRDLTIKRYESLLQQLRLEVEEKDRHSEGSQQATFPALLERTFRASISNTDFVDLNLKEDARSCKVENCDLSATDASLAPAVVGSEISVMSSSSSASLKTAESTELVTYDSDPEPNNTCRTQ